MNFNRCCLVRTSGDWWWHVVVFERGPLTNIDVFAIDLATCTTTCIETSIAATAAREQKPVVSGTMVVYERRATLADQGDIVLYDLATHTETALEGTAADARRPDINGNFVVWDLLRDGHLVSACDQLLDAYRRVDGQLQPPEFASGSAAADLRRRFQNLRASLGCP